MTRTIALLAGAIASSSAYSQQERDNARDHIPNLCFMHRLIKSTDPLPKHPTSFDRVLQYFVGKTQEYRSPLQIAAGWGADGEGSAFWIGIAVRREDFCPIWNTAIDRGDALGILTLLNVFYQNGVSANHFTEKAHRWMQLAARNGDREADFALGNCYYFGHGVEADAEEAAFYFEKAAKRGHLCACLNMAYFRNQGVGVAQDLQISAHWMYEAAKLGDKGAMFFVAERYRDRRAFVPKAGEAILWYRKAADAGHTGAMIQLASYFEKGWDIPKEPTLAFKWYTKARLAGDAEAIKQVARCYEDGIGVEKNREAALDYYIQAAKGGSESAQTLLALKKTDWPESNADWRRNLKIDPDRIGEARPTPASAAKSVDYSANLFTVAKPAVGRELPNAEGTLLEGTKTPRMHVYTYPEGKRIEMSAAQLQEHIDRQPSLFAVSRKDDPHVSKLEAGDTTPR